MRKDLGIYLHIPFCVRKCRYCDFLSFSSGEEEQEQYVKKLVQEIRSFPQKEKWRVTTIFFGGGTPSILKGEQISLLLKVIRTEFFVERNAEVSIECNPGTVDMEKLCAYRETGVNRISFGLQSSEEKELKLLGRIHTYEMFLKSYEMTRKCGFQNINVDLMSALPGQTPQSWRRTLQRVLSLQPEHISAYSLIIEEGTPFYDLYEEDRKLREAGKECHILPSEEAERQMYYDTKKIMEEHGYFRYEISNYSKPGYECRHNMAYWERKNYAGFGLGAAALMENVRFTNTSDFQQYMKGKFEHDREALDEAAQMEEFLFLGLRMMKGVSTEQFFLQFGVTMESVYGSVLERLTEQKLIEEKMIEHNGKIYRLSDFGIDVSNYVLAQFLF